MRRTIFLCLAGALTAASGLAHAETNRPAGYFGLQTQFQAPEGKCFEGYAGNAADATHQGASHMAACEDVTGQAWKAILMPDGHFQLTNMLGDNLCLEGQGGPAEGAELGGAAHMTTCGNDHSGQAWKAEPVGDGFFRLKSELAGAEKCLEGNDGKPESVLSGAAFMDACQDVSGQLWSIEGGSLVDGVPTAN